MPNELPAPAAPPPYLEGELRERFDRWLDGAVERHAAALTRAELRKGVQALSALYVEDRGRGRLGERALQGAAKRAAFATYYSGLHFLCVHHALRTGAARLPRGMRRVLDLGCGTGAAGAAAALGCGEDRLEILGIDRSGWAVAEARRTYRSFGLRGRTRRASLPDGLGRPGGPALAVAGWAINELADQDREPVRRWLADHVRAGGGALLIEPLAGAAAPWWDEWAETFAPLGVRGGELRLGHRRAEWFREMDRAAGLDHEVLVARVLSGPAP